MTKNKYQYLNTLEDTNKFVSFNKLFYLKATSLFAIATTSSVLMGFAIHGPCFLKCLMGLGVH